MNSAAVIYTLHLMHRPAQLMTFPTDTAGMIGLGAVIGEVIAAILFFSFIAATPLWKKLKRKL
jgi:hypothetical protein